MDKYIKFSEVMEYLRNRNDEARQCGHEETYFDLLTIIDGLKNMETVPASAVGKDTNVPAKWIPFTADTMPKEDGEYLIIYEDGYAEDYDLVGCVGIADFHGDCEAFGYWQDYYDPDSLGFVDSDFVEIKVKKWMPIPKEE